jgi:hypothetical protein
MTMEPKSHSNWDKGDKRDNVKGKPLSVEEKPEMGLSSLYPVLYFHPLYPLHPC